MSDPLHLRLHTPVGIVELVPSRPGAQENLAADLRALIAEYADHGGLLLPAKDIVAASMPEVVSAATVARLDACERLFQQWAKGTLPPRLRRALEAALDVKLPPER